MNNITLQKLYLRRWKNLVRKKLFIRLILPTFQTYFFRSLQTYLNELIRQNYEKAEMTFQKSIRNEKILFISAITITESLYNHRNYVDDLNSNKM